MLTSLVVYEQRETSDIALEHGKLIEVDRRVIGLSEIWSIKKMYMFQILIQMHPMI